MRSTCILFALLLASCTSSRTGAGHAVRDTAALRGLRFLESVAADPVSFHEYGADLMWAFYTLSQASADPVFRQEALDSGKRLASRWRDANPVVPSTPGINQVYNLISGSETADDLGLVDDHMRLDLAKAASRFGPQEWLGFNPAVEPPPSDIPQPCKRFRHQNPRGAKVCRHCGDALRMTSRYDILFDALVTTYSGQHYGVKLGGTYADVLQWLPSLRPYPPPANGRLTDDFSLTYAITHIIYTLNDYCLFRLRPEWLPAEFSFLKEHAQKAIDEHDPETLGEFLDSLQSFGLTDRDPLIRNGIDYLLAHQNPDGSWGSTQEPDIYTRYHTTWTGIGGVMRYAWRGTQVTAPDALSHLRGQ